MTRHGGLAIRHAARIVLLAWASVCLAACAALPDDAPVVEQLDEDTGVTVARLGRPVELYLESGRREGTERFAFLGPFETNRMGARETFLWVAVPLEDPEVSAAPTILVDGAALGLGEATRTAELAGLRQSPYKIPTPWLAMYYFHIGADIVTRLGTASDLRIRAIDQTRSGPLELEFIAPAGQDSRLAAFSTR